MLDFDCNFCEGSMQALSVCQLLIWTSQIGIH